MLNSILRHERLYFSDFTMLIFDECHNCTEMHPYRGEPSSISLLDPL